MITLSLCMIVKNEEDSLGGCLRSVAGIFDEIIIADTGSNDRTKEIASEFTDLVFDYDWNNDFSAARNFAFGKASMDYIMWLDADDVILPEDAAKLLELKQTLLTSIDVVMMRYNTGFDSHGNVTFSFFRERLAKRECGFEWKEPVHEYLETSGNIINSDICVTHAKPKRKENAVSERNIRIYESLLADGHELTARGTYYFARELKEHGKYADAIKWFNKFLCSGKGWVEDNIAACGVLAKCLMEEAMPGEALAALFRSFEYDLPRGEICCQIGYWFLERYNYRQAAFWFELILGLKMPEDKWGFCRHDCWGYIPCIELTVCYDKLGEHEKAESFNEMAAVYKPDSPAVQFNREYFEKLKKPCLKSEA